MENEQALEKPKNEKPFITFVVELPFLITIAFILAWTAKALIVQPFFIPSASMEPTLDPRDQILVNRFIYRFREPRLGDIVVFKYPVDPKKDFIKRVIGTPGHELEVKDGHVYIDSKLIREDYVASKNDTSNYGPIKIPEGKIFVMGDNRASSFDSRIFGLVPMENLKGETFLIYWPPDRIRVL